MPKTRFDQYTKQPVDKVKALILERKVALGKVVIAPPDAVPYDENDYISFLAELTAEE